MSLALFTLIVPILFIVFVLVFVFIRVLINPLNRIPGYSLRRPFFGSYGEHIRRNCRIIYFGTLDRLKYGTIRTNFMFFGRIRLDISDPYWIKHILSTNSKNYERGDFPGGVNIFFAVGENGLIVVDGEKHKRLRKLASPAFKLSALKKVMPLIEMCGDRMVKLFKISCDENKITSAINDDVAVKTTEIFVKDILNKTTLDVIGLIAFGHDFREACSFETGTFGCHIRDWLEWGGILHWSAMLPLQKPFKRFFIDWTPSLPKFVQNSRFFILAHTTNLIHQLVEGIVQSKIEDKINGFVELNNGKTLLDLILDQCDTVEVSQKEVHDLLMTFLIAGHETSTLSINWTLYLLSKHPEYQVKCRQEVKNFFDEHGAKAVEWDDIHKLSFLNAVIYESLRLYPPVPSLPRKSISTDTIGDYEIPAQTDFLLFIHELQRNEEYWTNPNDFLPERFLEPHDTIPWEAYLPFGDGVHKCIGYQLALTETLYFVAVLLKNFEFTIDDSIDYQDYVTFTMNPYPKMKLGVKVLH